MKKLSLLLLLSVPIIIGLQSFDQNESQQTILADTVCFSRDILPIINSNCAQSGCHDATSHKDGYTLTSYSGIMKGVKAGSPTTSALYNQINTNKMPQAPYNRLSDTMKTLVRLWIQQGAKNSTCPTVSCDSLNISYATTIKPIITFNCLGCHSGANPDGGINLADDDIVDGIKDKILCCITHSSGCVAMPKNNIKLTSCQTSQMRTWVNGVQSNVNNNDPSIEYLTVTPTVVNDEGKISFSIHRNQHITISLYTYDGRELRRIVNGVYDAGKHEVALSASSLQQGVYFVRLRCGDAIRSAMFVR